MAKSKQEVYENTFNKVLNFLAYAPRSTKEVEDRIFRYLLKKDLSQEEKEEIKEQIMSDLERMRVLNDEQYAKDYVRSKTEGGKPVSRRKLQEFLFKKGIPKEISEEALKQFEQSREEEFVEELAKKKLSMLKEKDTRILRQKTANYLLGKGFNPGLVFETLDKLLRM